MPYKRSNTKRFSIRHILQLKIDRLCGLVVRGLNYRTRGPGFDSGALQKKVVGLERGPFSLVSWQLLRRQAAVSRSV
jgi:hypothetical protein